jgi:hypothetical protein
MNSRDEQGERGAVPLSHRDLIDPTGGGFMPLFDAVAWIASKGGAEQLTGFNPDTRDGERVSRLWDAAMRELIEALEADRLAATGVKVGSRERDRVPPGDWVGVVIDRLGTEPYLALCLLERW